MASRRTLGLLALASGCVLCLSPRVRAYDIAPTLPSYPWLLERPFTSLDHGAVRRGWQVYRTVCQTCHSLQYVRFGDLVNVTHTEAEAKAIAADYPVIDGPNEEGEYYERPGRLSDRIPPPYANEEAARAANFGAHPPDLTYIVEARKNGRNYLFSLLTGWMEPPAGVALSDHQHYNAYFPGGVTAMAEMLFDGLLDYEDGTPATCSQMAKDVVEFLSWTAAQEHDARQVLAIRALGILLILLACFTHTHRRLTSFYRSQAIAHVRRRPQL